MAIFRESWKHLGDMDGNDAKIEYIKLVKEVDPKWDEEQDTVCYKICWKFLS